jgi:hypothetical protein
MRQLRRWAPWAVRVREGSSGARYNVHEEDAHDISLEQRLAVVLAAAGSVTGLHNYLVCLVCTTVLTSATTQLW